MSESNAGSTETVSKAEYDKLVEKAHKLEGEAVDKGKRIEAFSKLGDPESVSARLTELELLKKEKAGGNKDEWEKLFGEKEASIRTESQKAIDAANAEAKSVKARLRELTLVDKVFGLAASKFNDDTHEDVKDYIRKHCDITDDGEIVVKNDKGEIRYREGKPSEKMDANDFVTWLANTKTSWAKPATKSGTGQGNNTSTNGKGSEVTLEKFQSMTAAEQDALPTAIKGALSMQILKGGVLRSL